MSKSESITGIYKRLGWISGEADSFHYGELEDGTEIEGKMYDDHLQKGVFYEFYGKWVEKKGRRKFAFDHYIVRIPNTREGIIAYLSKFCVGIGPSIAGRMYDEWGADAVKTLRTDPWLVANNEYIARTGFTLEKAVEASKSLAKMAHLEDTKIKLMGMFEGRSFPGTIIDECIREWDIRAPLRISRDPFAMLVAGLSGCGFARCDKMYLDFALPPERRKRQTICLWHILNSDKAGHTWLSKDYCFSTLKQSVGSANIRADQALEIGTKTGWIAKYKDAESQEWLAEGKRAAAERYIAKKIAHLEAWSKRGMTATHRSLIAEQQCKKPHQEPAT